MNPTPPNPPRLAARMRDIAPFHVMELLQKARALEAAGRSVITLCVGEPDFPTPQPMVDAALAFIRKGDVHYTAGLGLPALREAISGYYAERFGLDVPASRIVVTTGASAALQLLLGVLVNPGDEWLLPDPGYPCNRHFVRMYEGRPVALPVDESTDFQPTAGAVDAAWRAETRGLMIASPSNPTGTVLDAPTLANICTRVRTLGGHVVVDEIYQGLNYGCEAHTALACDPDAFVINSFSKYFGMTGWRLGWLVAPQAYMRDIEKLAQNLFICAPVPAQYAALAAFSPQTRTMLEARRAEFARRRDFLRPALESIGLRIAGNPRGAFYLYTDVSSASDDSHRYAHELLDRTGVAITPGLDFGENASARFARIAYTHEVPTLEAAVERIARMPR
ncbi:MAG TPA: pyridoxal phosphate-dependent aminotransferase [Rhodocyclaceae bacterium]|nr:pyridoxal phosphate-dependent aminotransferase [Rhodocyclaceae bacterium]